MIDPTKLTAFDVETKGIAPLYGLQPFRAVSGEAWLTTCAVAYLDNGEVVAEGIVKPTVEQLSAWLDSIIEAGHSVVCWNAPFDVAWLLALDRTHPELGIRAKVYKIRWLDGLLLYRHIINAPRFRPDGVVGMGLKVAVAKFLPEHAGYEEDIDFDDESPENTAKLLEYNQRDSMYTLTLAIDFLGQMTEHTQRCAVIEAACIPDVAESYVEGIRLDATAAVALGEKLEKDRRLAFMTMKLKHPEVSEEILASPVKLRKLLFEDWGLPPVELTETGEVSTNKATLTELAVVDERAKWVHEYRDAKYCLAKFSTTPQESLAYNGDGRTRPQARLFGTYTGRMTYSSKVGKGVGQEPSGVAMHQWKRDPEYRALILPPEDYELVEFDFAGQEYRWMAVESGDPQMLSLCVPGEDPHSFMGSRIAGVDYQQLKAAAGNDTHPDYKAAKAKRQLGKVGNLALQYRMYPPTLVRTAAVQHKVKLTLEEARAIHATYLTSYRKVPDYWRRQIKLAKAQGFVQTLAGRRVILGHPSTWVFADGNDAKWAHESTAINTPIQGIGADQKYLGLLCMHDLCLRYGARFYFELHDGMFYVVPKQHAAKFEAEGKYLLSNLPYKRAWGVNLPIMFPVDAKRGPSWGELKEAH